MLSKAVSTLAKGRFAVLFDGPAREGECDLVIHAGNASPRDIEFMRVNAGGLICLATDKPTADKIGLPFFHDLLLKSKALSRLVEAKMPYGDKPAFSIFISHRGTYTGVTDNDRSLTMHKFAEMLASRKWVRARFFKEFRAPGHVPLLIGKGLKQRRGHTELSLELCRLAGLAPAVVLCEMLGRGKALPKAKAKSFAEKHGLPFVEGKEIVKAIGLVE